MVKKHMEKNGFKTLTFLFLVKLLPNVFNLKYPLFH